MKIILLITAIMLGLSSAAFTAQKTISLKAIESFKSAGTNPVRYLVLLPGDGSAFFIESNEDIAVKVALSVSPKDTLTIQYDENALVKLSEQQYGVRNLIK